MSIEAKNPSNTPWYLEQKTGLFQPSKSYRPFRYHWAYEAWEKQQQMHWLSQEVPMHDDVLDWRTKLQPHEINLLTQILRFFTQSDVEVGGCYFDHYLKVFQPIEIRKMLICFANMETIHMQGYSFLLDTLGMPELEYEAFLKYKEMSDKCSYLRSFSSDSLKELTLTLAVFSAFVEGLQLFGSFVILLNFPRYNKMRGMGQIVTLSVRDESLHVVSMLKLFKTLIQENPHLWNAELIDNIRGACENIVKHEDAFIDLAFEMGAVEGLNAAMVKSYIRYIANLRMQQLELEPMYDVIDNPLPWMDAVLQLKEFANFFETRVTQYSKGSIQGSWSNAFDKTRLTTN